MNRTSQKETKSRKRKKLPPGQRLIRYFVFALLVSLVPAWAILNGPNLKIADPKPEVGIAEPFHTADEQKDLENQLRTLTIDKPLRLGVFAIDPQTSKYVDVDGRGQFCAASIIKLPILVAALLAIDHHAIDPKSKLTIKKELVTGGSGHLQWQPIGTKVPFMEVARLMMVFSDNTATNMIIDALGGKDPLNKNFKTWGLNQTKLNNYLGDFAGTNKTSPYDLVYLLARVDRGEFISKESRQWMLDTLKKTKVRTLLIAGLGPAPNWLIKQVTLVAWWEMLVLSLRMKVKNIMWLCK